MTALAPLTLAVIGGGNMGAAFARAAVRNRLVAPERLLIIERDKDRRSALGAELSCRVEADLSGAISEAEIILLAVKPQDLGSCSQSLRGHLRERQIVLSVLAGITIEALQKSLDGHGAVVRCMPNTPAQIGTGMSVFCSDASVPAAAVERVVALLDAAGKTIRVQDESLLDAATAVSGSGPAYVFYFIEHYIRAARELGFSQEEARLLVGQTIAGALRLWIDGKESAEQLRAQVTSKGGTTEAGIAELERGRFGEVLREATKAARRRCKELLAAQTETSTLT